MTTVNEESTGGSSSKALQKQVLSILFFVLGVNDIGSVAIFLHFQILKNLL